jgi:ATP-dependent metalloprotease
MVAKYGMSAKLGPMEYGNRYKELSSETRAIIEAEVQRTLSESYENARKLLLSKRKELDLLAKALVEYETLDKFEVEKVIRGEKLPGRIPVPKGPMSVPVNLNDPSPGLPPDIGSGDDAPPAPPVPGSVGNIAAPEKPLGGKPQSE